VAMKVMSRIFLSHRLYEAAQDMARVGQLAFERKGQLTNLPGMAGEWTKFRDLKPVPKESFRDWWKARATKETV